MSAAAVRAFVAIELDAAARARIAAYVETLRSIRGLRIAPPEGLHLTLRFLGPSAPEALGRLEPEIRAAASACAPAEAAIGPIGTFPERGAPRVLWLGIALPGPLLALQAACERAAVVAGFPREPRPFRPHLTLGRYREGGERPGSGAPELGDARLEQLVLFRSELRPSGAVYTPLATFPLGGSSE